MFGRPFHEQVRAVRMMRGWSQSDLADELGVGAARLTGVESGEHSPQLAKAALIAEALDCTLVVLLVPNELTGLGKEAGVLPLQGLRPGPKKRSRPPALGEEEL